MAMTREEERALMKALPKAIFKVLQETRNSEDHVYSFSRLTTADCLKRFYLKYVLKQEEPSGPPAIQGKIVHETVAGLIDPERLKDVVVPGSFEMYAETAKVGVDLDEAVNLILAAKACPGIGKVETYHRVNLDPSDPFSPLLQVYIDLDLSETKKNNTGKVLDWKTHHVDFEPTDNHQLGLYSWVLSQKYGYQEVDGVLRFLRYKGKKCSKRHTYTAEEMEGARKWAYTLACDLECRLGQLEFGGDPEVLFPANPESGQCKYCSFVCECQKQSESKKSSFTASVKDLEKGELKINLPEEAADIAAEVLRLKAAHDKLQNALKDYCKRTGDVVEVADQQYGSSTSISWSFNAEQKKEIAKAIAEEGINPWEIFALGSTQLKNKQIDALGWDETTYKKFGGKQKITETYKWTKAQSEGKEEAKNVKVS
ncbi:MAG: PD-(D/E)XK nuclease family protein [Desulfitobacteriia bacterium]|jgi:hypothetical protein